MSWSAMVKMWGLATHGPQWSWKWLDLHEYSLIHIFVRMDFVHCCGNISHARYQVLTMLHGSLAWFTYWELLPAGRYSLGMLPYFSWFHRGERPTEPFEHVSSGLMHSATFIDLTSPSILMVNRDIFTQGFRYPKESARGFESCFLFVPFLMQPLALSWNHKWGSKEEKMVIPSLGASTHLVLVLDQFSRLGMWSPNTSRDVDHHFASQNALQFMIKHHQIDSRLS